MMPKSEEITTKADPMETSQAALVNRLEALSQEPTFRLQREVAFNQALRPYAAYAQTVSLFPLPEEMALATLYLFADYYPDDGQFTLIEQMRDTIDVHVPEEERAWLDPLKHSYMDLLEVVTITEEIRGSGLTLRSLGSLHEFQVTGKLDGEIKLGQVLLTRLIRLPDGKERAIRTPLGRDLAATEARLGRAGEIERAVLPMTGIILAATHAKAILSSTHQWRREMEAEAGSFELGEWEEFAKRYGYVLLWMFAQTRLEALLKADAGISYRTPAAHSFFYAMAIYEHHEFARLTGVLNRIENLHSEPVGSLGDDRSDHRSVGRWIQRNVSPEGFDAGVSARVTLTPVLLIVECETPERLNNLKHRLASELGYALHFMGESTSVPAHDPPVVDLRVDMAPVYTVVVTRDEEYRLLKAFLESVYLEWSDRPSPALNGLTPRHAAAVPETRAEVATLIEQLERDDLARRRTGRAGYDYNILRAHVGLEG